MNNSSPPFTLLLCIRDENLVPLYEKAAKNHNKTAFDLFCPRDIDILPGPFRLDFDVRVCMVSSRNTKHGMFLQPTSPKTPLLLANHIISPGEEAIADVHNTRSFVVDKHARLFQICAPDLGQFDVKIVSLAEFLNEI
jgi:hypothetical protein